MARGRRTPPPVPYLARMDMRELARQLSILWQYVYADHTGLPAEHSSTHGTGGSDPTTGGGGNAVEAVVDLGSTGGFIFGPYAVAATWVTATTKIVCAPFATTADGQTIETVAASGLQAVA